MYTSSYQNRYYQKNHRRTAKQSRRNGNNTGKLNYNLQNFTGIAGTRQNVPSKGNGGKTGYLNLRHNNSTSTES